jgi:hypothetical protein
VSTDIWVRVQSLSLCLVSIYEYLIIQFVYTSWPREAAYREVWATCALRFLSVCSLVPVCPHFPFTFSESSARPNLVNTFIFCTAYRKDHTLQHILSTIKLSLVPASLCLSLSSRVSRPFRSIIRGSLSNLPSYILSTWSFHSLFVAHNLLIIHDQNGRVV